MKLLFVILFLSLVGCTKQSSQHIPSSDMLESTFDEQAASPPLVATFHKPEGDGLFPTVVLMHGCSGLIREANISLLSYANFLNENGYSALILDSFGGRKRKEEWYVILFLNSLKRETIDRKMLIMLCNI